MPHNGGRSQLGLGWPYDPDLAFLNYAKRSQRYIDVSGLDGPTPDELTARGYPIALPASGIYSVCNIDPQAQRPGNLVIKWTGEATFGWHSGGGSNTVLSGSLSGTNGRAVFSYSQSGDLVWYKYTAVNPANPVTNLIICHEDDEAAIDNGEIFGYKFMQRLREGNPGAIRFMDTTYNNIAMTAKWSHRKNIDYFSWQQHEFPPSIYSATTNSGNDYSATLSGFTLTDKARILVRWNATATGTATLNVSGTGAITIKNKRGDSSSIAVPVPTANSQTELIYDADLNCWMAYGMNNGHGIENGWPPEICIALCNEIGAHPWFNTPYLSTDDFTSSDSYMKNLAETCRDTLESGLIPRFEGPNETWNTAPGFAATQYGINKTAAWGWSGANDNDWYGKVMSELGQCVSAVYGGDRSRYQVVAGMWVNDPNGSTNVPKRLNSSAYVANEAGEPAKDWVTNIAISMYWGGADSAVNGTQTEVDRSFAYPDQSAEDQAQTIYDYCNENQSVVDYNTSSMQTQVARTETWMTTAATYSLAVCFYEGGYSPDYIGRDVIGGMTSISKAAQAVVVVPAWNSIGNVVPPVGSEVTIYASPGMTEILGTHTVVARDLNARTFTIDVDSTGFGTYTSGGAYFIVGSQTLLNAFRKDSKYEPTLAALSTSLYQQITDLGAEFPSHFYFMGNLSWGAFEDSMWAEPAGYWQSIVDWNSVAATPAASGSSITVGPGQYLATNDGTRIVVSAA